MLQSSNKIAYLGNLHAKGKNMFPKRKVKPHCQFLHGFTLIELLVVIAIISLLVAILLPSLSKAKELARQAVCSSKLRTMGLTLCLYAEDNGEKIPYAYSTHANYYWTRQTIEGIATYLEIYDKDSNPDDFGDAFLCPSAERKELLVYSWGVATSYYYIAYGPWYYGSHHNDWLIEPPSSITQSGNENGSQPFSGIVISDTISYYTGSSLWTGNHVPGNRIADPDENTNKLKDAISNNLYIDGHVERSKAGDLEAYLIDPTIVHYY